MQELINRVFDNPTLLLDERATALRRDFSCAVLNAVDRALEAKDVRALGELHGELLRLIGHSDSDQMGIELVDMMEYAGFASDQLENKQPSVSRAWLQEYRKGILDCTNTQRQAS